MGSNDETSTSPKSENKNLTSGETTSEQQNDTELKAADEEADKSRAELKEVSDKAVKDAGEQSSTLENPNTSATTEDVGSDSFSKRADSRKAARDKSREEKNTSKEESDASS